MYKRLHLSTTGSSSLSVGMVGGNFRSGTDTSGPKGGTLVSGNQDCRLKKREIDDLNSLNLKGGCEAKSWPDIIFWSQDGTCTSDAPCRSSVDDSVSLTTTALVTCMSGCCCLASCIAIAKAWKERVNCVFKPWILKQLFFFSSFSFFSRLFYSSRLNSSQNLRHVCKES